MTLKKETLPPTRRGPRWKPVALSALAVMIYIFVVGSAYELTSLHSSGMSWFFSVVVFPISFYLVAFHPGNESLKDRLITKGLFRRFNR